MRACASRAFACSALVLQLGWLQCTARRRRPQAERLLSSAPRPLFLGTPVPSADSSARAGEYCQYPTCLIKYAKAEGLRHVEALAVPSFE